MKEETQSDKHLIYGLTYKLL